MHIDQTRTSRRPASPPPSSSPCGRRARLLISTLVAVPALLAAACSGGAPAAPSQPTVQAVATQVVGAASPAAATVQAVASPAAATMQAAASPVAATVQAAASPAAATMQAVAGTAVAAASPLASPSPSPAAGVPIRIADASLSDATPWLSLQNESGAPIDVGGWTLQVGMVTAQLPPDAIVDPGGTLTLHAGPGLSSEDQLYLGNAGDALAAAALPGTPVRLLDDDGRLVSETTVPRF